MGTSVRVQPSRRMERFMLRPWIATFMRSTPMARKNGFSRCRGESTIRQRLAATGRFTWRGMTTTSLRSIPMEVRSGFGPITTRLARFRLEKTGSCTSRLKTATSGRSMEAERTNGVLASPASSILWLPVSAQTEPSMPWLAAMITSFPSAPRGLSTGNTRRVRHRRILPWVRTAASILGVPTPISML